jgi:hypothetical protein
MYIRRIAREVVGGMGGSCDAPCETEQLESMAEGC